MQPTARIETLAGLGLLTHSLFPHLAFRQARVCLLSVRPVNQTALSDCLADECK